MGDLLYNNHQQYHSLWVYITTGPHPGFCSMDEIFPKIIVGSPSQDFHNILVSMFLFEWREVLEELIVMQQLTNN